MKQVSLHDKAIRLVEGGVVECGGHFVGFKKCSCDGFPCRFCEVDCACHGEILDLCLECCSLAKGNGYLILNCNEKK